MAAMESNLLIKGGPALDLSEQMCVDCVSTSSGCGGVKAFECLQWAAEHGLATEQS